MKHYFLRAAIAASVLFSVQDLIAQDQQSDSLEKAANELQSLATDLQAQEQEVRSKIQHKLGEIHKKLGEYDEIIIKRKDPRKNSKVTIEIKDGQVTIDGKPLDQYESDELAVLRRNARRYNLGDPAARNSWQFKNKGGETQAFLGVSTESSDQGARIANVSDNSAAEKAGLKKDDIITKLNGIALGGPEELIEAVARLKPDEKVEITYKRDGKEKKTTATLGKRKDSAFTIPLAPIAPLPPMNFNFNDDNELNRIFSFAGKARLGIKAQDTEEGKGVKVLEVDEGSAADKAGIKKDDLITSFEGKEVNSADELASASREAKDKSSLKIQLKRNGKSQSVEVKVPRKLKTANL